MRHEKLWKNDTTGDAQQELHLLLTGHEALAATQAPAGSMLGWSGPAPAHCSCHAVAPLFTHGRGLSRNAGEALETPPHAVTACAGHAVCQSCSLHLCLSPWCRPPANPASGLVLLEERSRWVKTGQEMVSYRQEAERISGLCRHTRRQRAALSTALRGRLGEHGGAAHKVQARRARAGGKRGRAREG